MEYTPILKFPQASHADRWERLGPGKSKKLACVPKKMLSSSDNLSDHLGGETKHRKRLVNDARDHTWRLLSYAWSSCLDSSRWETAWETTGPLNLFLFLMWPLEKKIFLLFSTSTCIFNWIIVRISNKPN